MLLSVSPDHSKSIVAVARVGRESPWFLLATATDSLAPRGRRWLVQRNGPPADGATPNTWCWCAGSTRGLVAVFWR